MIPILFVDSAEALGGAEHSLLLLMSHLDRQRFEPLLACNEGPLAERARAAGEEVHTVPMRRLRRSLGASRSLVRGTRGLVRLARERGVAVIHTNVMRASFYAAAAARWAGLPLVWHVRDLYPRGWYVRLLCSLSRRVLAVSAAAAAPIPCPDRLDIVPNGVDLEAFAPRVPRLGARQRLGLPEDATVVGALGRVRPWKRQDLFVRMAARVARERPEAYFVLIGDTIFPDGEDHLSVLRALAAELGLAARISFPGHREDVADVLSALDLFVHPTPAEPFGRVLIEAMAMARPVVAYAGGGATEIVIDDETGRLVAPGDVEAMADAVVELLDDAELRRRMGEAGRRRVVEHFDARRTARRVEAVYTALLEGR